MNLCDLLAIEIHALVNAIVMYVLGSRKSHTTFLVSVFLKLADPNPSFSCIFLSKKKNKNLFAKFMNIYYNSTAILTKIDLSRDYYFFSVGF